MSGSIESTAIIAPSANIHPGASIGHYSLIGDGVTIGDKCEIASHVVIKGPTTIGNNNRIFQFCSIGEECQHSGYKGEATELIIGDNNIFRESCTIHRGSPSDKGVTRVGNNNFLLVNAHIAHDCIVGDHNVFANNTSLGGHVYIGSHVVLGGHTAVHQYCRVGDHAFVGRCATIVRDTPPYTLSAGNLQRVYGINTIGLKRQKFNSTTIQAIKKAYHIYYHHHTNLNEALENLKQFAAETQLPEVQLFTQFIDSSQRGIVR